MFCLGCKKNADVEVLETVSKSYNTSNRNFKLKDISKVEILSYPDRIMWDTLSFKGKTAFNKELVSENKLTFDSTLIKERIILDKNQVLELTKIMASDACEPEEMPAACYMPRHLIIFKNKDDKIIAYNEFCFTCIGSRNSKNIDNYQKFCLGDIKQFFKKVGIKYFVENEKDEIKEHKFLKDKGYINY